MKILLVQETDWLSRPPIIQHHLAERLARRGHDVRVIDYDIDWRQRKERRPWQSRRAFLAVTRVVEDVHLSVTRPGIVRLPLLCHLSWAATSTLELGRSIQNWGPDVVIGLSLTNSYLMALTLKRAGVPYVSLALEPYHTMMPQGWVRPVARIVERLALHAANRVVVFAPKMRTYVEDMGAEPSRVDVLKTVVSLDLFRADVDGSTQRKDLGIDPDEWVVLFAGWLYEFSGLREIVRAICSHPSLLGDARLLIAGDGAIFDELAGLVARHSLNGKIILTGLIPYQDMPAAIAASDVGLMPFIENETTRDIGPMKIYEYLACGKPVVAVPLPGIFAEFGMDSGIFWADDPVAALKSAVALADNRAEAHRRAEIGRHKVEEYGGWEEMTCVFEQVLEQVVGSAHPAGH